MIINPIIYGTSGMAAEIFITGLSETDTVTCTKDGKAKQGKWVSKTNPDVSIPAEYTQLEYIESSGAQYIDTDVSAPNGFKAILDWMFTDFSGDNNKTVLGSEDSASPWACNWLQKRGESAYTWHLGAYSEYVSSTTVSVNTQYDIDMSTIKGASYLKVDGNSIITDTNSNSRSSNSIYIFATNKAGTADNLSSARLYSCKIIKDDETVRNYIPAKRNSDGAVGLYDQISKTFFTNAGTGTFTAGSEIPSATSGWLFDKLKSYGTYTITATNGTNTATQDVLVDMAARYNIEMSYKLYLYNLGDECESVTGGWNAKNSNGSFTKNSTSFVLANGNINTNGLGVSVGKLIDLSKYTKLVTQWTCELTGSNSSTDSNVRVGFSPDASKGDLNMNPYARKDVNYSGLTEVNITSDAVGKYVTFTNYGYIKATVYKVWLE